MFKLVKWSRNQNQNVKKPERAPFGYVLRMHLRSETMKICHAKNRQNKAKAPTPIAIFFIIPMIIFGINSKKVYFLHFFHFAFYHVLLFIYFYFEKCWDRQLFRLANQ